MRPRTTFLAIALLVLLVALGSVACTSSEKPAPTSPPPTAATQPDGASLLQARCTRCHALDRVRQTPRTANEWQTVIARMRSHGAQLNDVEAEALVQHLAQTYGK
ncbi:MAG: hypothetical protein H5T65_08915 [Chloroflexi bacterium]|nr:hypothetical protein [Chloroflexota bacterium]